MLSLRVTLGLIALICLILGALLYFSVIYDPGDYGVILLCVGAGAFVIKCVVT